ncbi:energy transducer TonB [Gammaproteobacteria bacterium]|nr:energy transducer TonB [Gammaproteobacteria bacterium]
MLSTVPPRYPERARRTNKTGWVHFNFDLDGSGIPTNIRLIDEEPLGLFATNAKASLEQFLFRQNTIFQDCSYLYRFELQQ